MDGSAVCVNAIVSIINHSPQMYIAISTNEKFTDGFNIYFKWTARTSLNYLYDFISNNEALPAPIMLTNLQTLSHLNNARGGWYMVD